MRWKWILSISAAVIIVLLTTAFIIVASYDFNKLKPRITTITKDFTGRDLTIAGDIRLGLSLPPKLVVEDMAFQNAPWGSRPNMVTLKHIEIQVELLPLLRGDVRVENLRLVKPDFIIEVSKTGQSNMEFEVAEKSTEDIQKEEAEEQVAAFLGFKDITIKEGIVTFYDHRDEIRHVLSLKEYVRKAADFRAESEIKFIASYDNYTFEVQGRIGSLVNIFDPSQKWSLDLSAEAFESNFTITGSILDVINFKGIDLKLAAKGDNLTGFEKIVHKPLPLKGPYSFSGHLAAANLANIKISDIQILLGKNKLSGEVAIRQKSPRPRIDARLYSQKFDLRPYMRTDKKPDKSEAQPAETRRAKKEKVFSNEPFNFRALQQVDAGINLRVDQILGQLTAWENVDLNLNLQNGRLVIHPLAAGFGGGNLSVNLDLLTKGSHARLKTKINVEKADLKRMLKRLGITREFEGTLDLGINLKGQGKSAAELMAGLNGDVIIILGESKIPVNYLNFIGNMIGADFTFGLNQLINPLGEKINRARINCAVCDFNIKDGLAQSDVIIIDDPRKTLLSKGNINLKTEALDFGIHTEPKEGIGTEKTAKISVSLSKITRPFKLGGTLADPHLGVDPARTATTLGAALLGPVGWTYLLVSVSSGDENPCVKAREMSGEGKAEEKTASAKAKDQKSKPEKKSEGFGSKIKRLFSKPKD